MSLTLLWRRRSPLAMTAVSIGAFIMLDEVARIVEGEPVEAFTSAFVLIHFYALFRWGSGRHCAAGLGIMVAVYVFSLIRAWTGFGDAIGAAVMLLFLAVLGAEVRHLGQRREREREEVKALERELLARDLHDTVAHHVSAIAVQAQAGRVVGGKDPAAALEALAVIEAEASRTLAEMRSIVGTLRDGRSPASAEFAPQAGIDDISRFAETAVAGSGPAVTVDIRNVDHIGPTIGAALYRVAQEAVTNARRHAVDATRVRISVVGADDAVRLTVVDDGVHRRTGFDTSGGFGLIGMTERAELLGGTLQAGPDGARGWSVDATIPLGAPR
jgi:signal transduction histidine kinase